jgi:hypothetical protein
LLIDAGANPDAQDSFGNMILHMVVVCDKLVCDLKYYNENVRYDHVRQGSMRIKSYVYVNKICIPHIFI